MHIEVRELQWSFDMFNTRPTSHVPHVIITCRNYQELYKFLDYINRDTVLTIYCRTAEPTAVGTCTLTYANYNGHLTCLILHHILHM